MAQIEKAREQANLHHRYEDEGCGPDATAHAADPGGAT